MAKFEQLYKAGVRQFGVLGDDVGQLNRTIVVEVMNAVAAWADGKGDVYDTVFCPANYNHAYTNNNYGEINTYDTGFSENVQIFWTGEGVCKPIERATLDHFRRYQLTDGKTTRRAPLFWLNWPVNDINSARMLMGKGSLLHTDIDPADLAGVVTNPMQEAESSKVALFAIADYAWNVKGFNDDQSWKDSFQYIDGNAAAELYTLAKHMSDPSPNGHGLVLEESEELKPLLENYETKLEAGTLTEEELTGLMAEFQGIAEACDGFHEKSGNENLKDELKPFTDSLKEQALAAVEYLRAQQSIKDGNSNEVWNHYAQGNTYLADSKKHVKPILKKAEGKNITDEGIVAPSAKRITPFVENLGKTLSPLVSGLIDDSKLIRTYITSRADSPATGSLTEIFDGNIDSEAIYKTPNRIAKGEYVGVKYSKKIAIENIRIVLGSGVDHFDHGKLQYTEDGYAWKDLELTGMTNEFQGVRDQIQDVTVAKENLPENFRAMGIRFIATQANANAAWLRVREIMINGFEAAEEETEIYTNKESVTGFTSNLTNDSAVLSSSSPVSLTPGEFVGLQLERIKDISEITVEGTGVEALTLQTSKNAVVWNDVNLSARAGYEDARYIRLINKTDADVTATLTNLTVKSLEFQPISKFETNYITTTTGNNPAETVMNLFDKDRTTETILRNAQEIQTEGDYIIYDLGQCIDLESLKLVLYDGTTDFPRHAKISVSTDHQHWEEVMTIGNQDSANEGEAENADSITGLFPVHEVSYNTLEATNIGKQARYLKFEITRTKQGAKKWVRMREIELNGGNFFMAESNDPTIQTTAQESQGNIALNMIDGDLSTAFRPKADEAGSITYYISENTDVKRINIMQSPDSISNAVVKAEVLTNNELKSVTLGKLSASFNKFNTSAYEHVLSVSVEWEAEQVPCIYEILTLGTIDENQAKIILSEYYDSVKDAVAEDYTADSWAEFEAARNKAREVLDREQATVEEISQAMTALDDAYLKLTRKQNVTPTPDPTPTPNPTPTPDPTPSPAPGQSDSKPSTGASDSGQNVEKPSKVHPTSGTGSTVNGSKVTAGNTKTGDCANTILWGMLLVSALFAGAITAKRRKEN